MTDDLEDQTAEVKVEKAGIGSSIGLLTAKKTLLGKTLTK